MLDATILIPTFRHPLLLPFALRSALAQDEVSFEVFVVGDGVEDDTREAVAAFRDDERVRFFDNEKGERNGERHRHEALREASGRIVCYLSDDDLLLADHVAEMQRLLESADFAHSAPFLVEPNGSLTFAPIDLADKRFRPLLRAGRWNKISLTGAAHTLDAYRRLPYGWRPAPKDIWSDLHMWRQFLELPDFRAQTGRRITALHMADLNRHHMTGAERVAEIERWSTRIQEEGSRSMLDELGREALRGTAVRGELRIHELKAILSDIQSTRWWRLRTWLASIRRK